MTERKNISRKLSNLFCLVEGEATSNAFSIKVPSNDTVDDLKKLIKAKKTPGFDDVAANKLTIWRVSFLFSHSKRKESIFLKDLPTARELDQMDIICDVFKDPLIVKSVNIIVQRPPRAPKRDRDEDAEPFSKGKRHRPHSLMDAINQAGLTEKAMVDGQSDLSRLDNKERVSLLDFIGREVDRTDDFNSLSSTARASRDLSFQELGLISTPSGGLFPVVGTEDLYVRQAYKDLYNEITLKFEDNPRKRGWKRVVVTGTSGIGKSAFLVYFTIRLLATSCDDNPPIVVFHKNGGSKCFVYGGVGTVRYGDIEDFRPFLNLRETWYLVDSAPNPKLVLARTIISVSPKTLYSEINQYQEIDKRVPWRYYMAPWMLEELEQCRGHIKDFQVVTKEFMEQLYDLIGGVPRYVLEKPKDVLTLDPDDYTDAKKSAHERVRLAIDSVKNHLNLMQCFQQGKDSLDFSCCLLHRWPSEDHKGFRLEWASAHVAGEVSKSLQDAAWKSILESLVTDTDGAARGVMFKTYVRHIFRKGDYEFQIKALQDMTIATFDIPANPKVEWFKEIPALSPGTLYIPKQCDYACVDLILAPQNWIGPSEEALLFFVVPSEIYDKFPEQKYLSLADQVYMKVPRQIQRVKQFVLKIDLCSASAGQSPGIRGSAF